MTPTAGMKHITSTTLHQAVPKKRQRDKRERLMKESVAKKRQRFKRERLLEELVQTGLLEEMGWRN